MIIGFGFAVQTRDHDRSQGDVARHRACYICVRARLRDADRPRAHALPGLQRN